jgi:formylglycine-generating enzyme
MNRAEAVAPIPAAPTCYNPGSFCLLGRPDKRIMEPGQRASELGEGSLMRKSIVVLLLAAFAAFAANALAVTINWTPVGNPGNPADTTLMSDGTSGYGSVGYNYNIGTYDVTNSQYAEFLNTKDPTGANTLGLWNSSMTALGGISFNGGNANGSKYTAISANQNHPLDFVTWYDAIRFANWLDNGQGNGDTETGAYTLLGGTPTPSNGGSITRNAGANVFLPSENEWYKAAYYDPRTTVQGGPPSDSHYWQYATGSNSTPIASAPTGLANHVNYLDQAVNLTDVGAYTGTTSPYGAFDMNGNVYQWNDTLFSGSFRGIRGGGYINTVASLKSSLRSDVSPSNSFANLGFRVAETPEPSTGVLAVIACGMIWWWRKRFK